MSTPNLSPQAEAIIAGMLDPKVRAEEEETGESQVFAPQEFWDELSEAFPPEKFYDRLNPEGQIE
jgi:hypothetical protein